MRCHAYVFVCHLDFLVEVYELELEDLLFKGISKKWTTNKHFFRNLYLLNKITTGLD